MTIHKKFTVGDLVKPGTKRNPGIWESPSYSSLHKDTIYVVTEVIDRDTGWQSVRLKPYVKGHKHNEKNHSGAGRFYASDNMTVASINGVWNVASTLFKQSSDSTKPNLAIEILGTNASVLTESKPGLTSGKAVLPTRIVVDVKTGLVVYKENVGRSQFVESRTAFDKTQTGGVDKFISDELRKNPLGEFAVYTLEKIGKVSEIRVSWE